MTPAVVRRLHPRAELEIPAPDPRLLPSLPTGPDVRLLLVDPGAVPPGAVVVAQLVAVPADRPDPPAAVLPSAALPSAALPSAAQPSAAQPSAAPAGDGVLVDPAGRWALVNGAELSLTRREFDLLDHLVRHPGRAFTRGQLLDAVWELPPGAPQPPRTVDVHVSRLRRKLGRHGHHLQSLRGVGYRWSPRAAPAERAGGAR